MGDAPHHQSRDSTPRRTITAREHTREGQTSRSTRPRRCPERSARSLPRSRRASQTPRRRRRRWSHTLAHRRGRKSAACLERLDVNLPALLRRGRCILAFGYGPVTLHFASLACVSPTSSPFIVYLFLNSVNPPHSPKALGHPSTRAERNKTPLDERDTQGVVRYHAPPLCPADSPSHLTQLPLSNLCRHPVPHGFQASISVTPASSLPSSSIVASAPRRLPNHDKPQHQPESNYCLDPPRFCSRKRTCLLTSEAHHITHSSACFPRIVTG